MTLIDGYYLSDGKPVRGHVVFDGKRTEYTEGPCRGTPDLRGVVLPMMTDCHTHCADAGVKVREGMTLEELVAPPDGLKHRYLRETPRGTLVRDMKGFNDVAKSNGIACFIDFREGGAEGCRMAREACPDAVILGRPVSREYDENEIDEILSVADGIALSSVSDIDRRYAEKVADRTHKLGKAFAIHCSERVREDLDAVLSLEPAFLVHMVEATDPDLRRCTDLDVPIAVCPRSNRFFGKVPPLARMKAAGCTVAMGTDNAMLCTPDLRPEAELFRNILGNAEDADRWTWQCLSPNAGKLLYRTRTMGAHKETENGLAILPFDGRTPESAWKVTGPVQSVQYQRCLR